MKPTIVFYHGGGFFVGSADTFEPAMYRIANITNCLVIYVEYRLIPEFKYPAPLDDCLLATKHLIKNHKKYKIDLDNLILMGDSAGGNLATVISQSLIEKKVATPKIQVLVYPIMQFFDFTLPAYRINLPKRILGQISHENFLNFIHYLTGHEAEDSVLNNGHTTHTQKDSVFSQYVSIDFLPDKFKNHNLQSVSHANDTKESYKRVRDILLSKEMSPLLVEDHHLIRYTPANTVLITTEMDILRDDGFIYAGRLKKLGLNIQHQHYHNMFHGIFGLCYGPIKFDGSDVLIEAISKSINDIVYQ
jgi:acetyl esterase/lipase